MNARVLLALLAVVAAPPAVARAEWVVSIGTTTLDPGQSGSVDVWVTGGPDRLDFFVAEFVLSLSSGGPTGGLRFTDPQPAGFATDPTAGYVFYGNSQALSQSVTQTLSPADTLTVGDLTRDGLGVDVSGGRLLARIQVSAGLGVTPGSVYGITLNPSSSVLQSPAFDELIFRSSPGSVTVGRALAVVPEPTSLTILTTGMVLSAGIAQACRRRARLV